MSANAVMVNRTAAVTEEISLPRSLPLSLLLLAPLSILKVYPSLSFHEWRIGAWGLCWRKGALVF